MPQDTADMRRMVVGALMSAVVFAAVYAFNPFSGRISIGFSAILAVCTASIYVFYPQLTEGRRGDRIDESLPFFITHFGVLATSNMPRQGLLTVLAENDEFPEAAAEMAKILRLTTQWGLSMADAVRAVAETTPSHVFSSFLLRLAQALESGQSLERFLESEQSVVMHEYATIYQANLLKVEHWKEMYSSMIMTIGFLGVFAVVIPLLSGGSILVLMGGMVVMTLFLEMMLGLMLQERLPKDRLRPRRPLGTRVERRIRFAVLGAAAASVVLVLATYAVLGPAGAFAVSAAPFLVPGLLALREEKVIRQRESDYPAFIRSVGAAAAARGGGVREVLGAVQANRLGALTRPVQALHRRLGWRIDDQRAWKRFGEETGSRLVDSFTDMFIEGLRAGGKPAAISQIISDNMVRVLALRTSRRATAGAFRGLLMGLAGGLALVLFMGSGIFSSLSDIFAGQADAIEGQGLLRLSAVPAPGSMGHILYPLMFAHGAASGIFYKLVEGGRIEGAGLFGALTIWVAVGVAAVTTALVPRLL